MAGTRRPTVLLQLWTAAHMAERLVAEHLQQAGISDEQFALLSRIALDGPVTPKALAAELGVPATTRASLAVYNTRDEVDRLVDALADVRRIFELD